MAKISYYERNQPKLVTAGDPFSWSHIVMADPATPGISTDVTQGVNRVNSWWLGLIFGMQYDKTAGPCDCFKAFDLNLTLLNEALALLTQLYTLNGIVLLGKSFRDMTDVFASLQNYCQAEVLIDQVVGLFSSQGLAQFAGRVSSALIIEAVGLIDDYQAASTDFFRAVVIGRSFSYVFEFYLS